MRGCVAFFIFIFVAAPLMLGFEVAAATSTFLVNRDFYSNVLAAPEIYEALLDGMVHDAGAPGVMLDSGEMAQITALLNSAEWRTAIEEAVDQAFAVLEGRSDTISIRIPLAPVRAILQSSAGRDFVRSYAEKLPICAGGREPMDGPETITGLPLPTCVPQALSRTEYADQLVNDLPRVIETMPDYMTYTDTLPEGVRLSGLAGIGIENAVQTAVIVFGMVAIGAWLVTGIIAQATTAGRLRWLGVTLLLPSAGVALIGLGLIGAASTGAMRSDIMIDGATSDRLSELVYESLVGGAGQISNAFLAAGGIPFVIGLLLLVIGLVVPASRCDEMQADMYANPTLQYGDKPKNEFDVFNKPKNDDKEKNDDIFQPL